MRKRMIDMIGNDINIGDVVIFSFVRESVAIGKVIKLCKKQIRISHKTLNAPAGERKETCRYPWQVVKYIGGDANEIYST